MLNSHYGAYELGIKQEKVEKMSRLLPTNEFGKASEQIVNRPTQEDDNDELRLTQTHLEQINANAEFREISKFLESILYLHLIPQLVRHPEAFAAPDFPRSFW